MEKDIVTLVVNELYADSRIPRNRSRPLVELAVQLDGKSPPADKVGIFVHGDKGDIPKELEDEFPVLNSVLYYLVTGALFDKMPDWYQFQDTGELAYCDIPGSGRKYLTQEKLRELSERDEGLEPREENES